MVMTNIDKESKKAKYKILYIDIKEFEKEFRKIIELTFYSLAASYIENQNYSPQYYHFATRVKFTKNIN